jgi:hypothetical protein
MGQCDCEDECCITVMDENGSAQLICECETDNTNCGNNCCFT